LLKLRLEQGDALDRHLEAAAKSLDRLLEAAAQERFIRIAAYPRPDSVLTAAALFSVAAVAGANPIMTLSERPPNGLTEPAILLGYQLLPYKAGSSEWPIVAVASEIKSSPPPGAVYVDGDGSTPALTAFMVAGSSVGGVAVDALRVLAAAVLYGGHVDVHGKLYGLDKVLYEDVLSQALGLELNPSLKAYRPVSLTLCESIAVTLDPVYPGLVGDPAPCRELLRGEGLGEYIERTMASLDANEVEKVAAVLLDHASSVAGDRLRLEEYLGLVPLLRRDPYVEDLRMLAHTLVFAAEDSREPGAALEAATAPDQVAGAINSYAAKLAGDLAETMDSMAPIRVKIVPWLKTFKVRGAEGLPPTLTWRALTLLGKLDKDTVIVYDAEDDLCISALQAELAAGNGIAKRLVDTKVAKLEGLELCVEETARPS